MYSELNDPELFYLPSLCPLGNHHLLVHFLLERGRALAQKPDGCECEGCETD